MFSATKDENIHDLKNSAQNLKNTATMAANDVKDDLQTTARKAGSTVRSYINTARDEVTHAGEAVGSQIRTNPIQSSLIALGIGFIFGALSRR